MQMWTCCKRNYVGGIAKCRVCGSPRKTYGIVDEPPKGTPRATPMKSLEEQGKVKHEKANRRKLANLPEPEGENFFVSTLKRKGE